VNDAREDVEVDVAQAIASSQDDGMLLGFVVVAEWLSTDGDRYLSRMSADGEGDPGAVPTWQRRGYLSEALTEWGQDDEEDE
jgi:hypothetical protein